MLPNSRSSFSFILIVCVVYVKALITDPKLIQDFLDNANKNLAENDHKFAEAYWNFETNITENNKKILVEVAVETEQFARNTAFNATQYDLSVMSPSVRRQFTKIMDIGTAAQTNETKLIRLSKVENEMETIYSTAKVCLNETTCVPLDPDITNIMAKSRDYNLLTTVWKGWSDASGKKMKDLYSEYVDLSNDAIRILGYNDTGAYWRSWYDTPTFEDDVRELWEQLRPLYQQLHAYARTKLKTIYGNDKFPTSGHIPAHILGNMWAQQWNNLIEEFTPYKDRPTFDVTDEMVKQNYTPLKMFQTADEFFQSLGLIPMPPEFWNKSMLEKPADGREVVCQASAWDFANQRDYRVKMCTVVNMDDFDSAHHEAGHIQYFMQYANQPFVFQEGASPGVHEAIGDVISLSLMTPEHMKTIGLLKTFSNDTESDLNFLMSMALQKIAFLPFGFLVDQWRWKVFRGEVTPEKYNEEWWNLRCKYQGIFPPVKRSSDDFDPGAKYHIPADVSYIRYFVSFVLQFQFHKSLCDAAGYTGPLHRCDIYNSKDAGQKLSGLLKLGSSLPWTESLRKLTGHDKMDAQPLIDYFQPLINYLKKINGDDYGWNDQCPNW
ncbi:hypothetical protein Btru_058674 [Bulinus truncatus]|nr:hypothetical protein Btru_058674 [Bulinus truncatus]